MAGQMGLDAKLSKIVGIQDLIGSTVSVLFLSLYLIQLNFLKKRKLYQKMEEVL